VLKRAQPAAEHLPLLRSTQAATHDDRRRRAMRVSFVEIRGIKHVEFSTSGKS
jgi:hypothetical protein